LDYACKVVIEHCDTKLIQIFKTASDGSIHLCAMECVGNSDNWQQGKLTFRHPLENTDINELLDPALIQRCLEKQEPISVSRYAANTDMCDKVYQTRQLHEIGSSVCIPLVYDAVVWGAFVVHRDVKKFDFSAADINLFGAISTQASVALNRQQLLSEIEFQAYHDSLTSLACRLKFEERLTAAVERGRINNTKVAVLFIDLDGFKGVNDNYGHATGDTLLKGISDRLLQIFVTDALVARMGGDEFSVVLTHVECLDEVIAISERTILELSQEFIIEGISVKVGASIGISVFPDDCDSAGTILKNADIAMYQAKSDGKNCVRYFDGYLASRSQARIENEADLADAINNKELRLVFQPKVSMTSGRVSGVEALLRWEHGSRGNIPPSDTLTLRLQRALRLSMSSSQ